MQVPLANLEHTFYNKYKHTFDQEGSPWKIGILHVDMNNFYASVETLFAPEYRDVPMAVAGDKESRHGIILAKNMLAKKSGCADSGAHLAGHAEMPRGFSW